MIKNNSLNQSNSLEGIIKFNIQMFDRIDSLPSSDYSHIEEVRERIFKKNLIGFCQTLKVGYGNISSREQATKNKQFVISGSQTGNIIHLSGEHYTRVLKYDLYKMSVQIQGPIEASSETLTHAGIYEGNILTKGVIHIHSKEIWNYLINNKYPSTPESAVFGTKELAIAIMEVSKELAQNKITKNSGLIVLKGHEDGVMAYGRNLFEAEVEINKIFQKTFDK